MTRHSPKFSIRSWVMALVVLIPATAVVPAILAAETAVAVAANFAEAAREIGTRFTRTTGHHAVFSSGSTGQLYTQITQEAPFDVFLAADRERPAKAEADGLAVQGSRFTYATGRIVLFSKDGDLVQGPGTLSTARFEKIAIANPVTAPYGSAAVEAMKAMGVYDALRDRIVQGTNISQTYQFVATGNAELGFVALSQIVHGVAGSRWIVPENLYSPIAQDAVLLRRGADNEAAKAFLEFLRGPEARTVKESYGYGIGDQGPAPPNHLVRGLPDPPRQDRTRMRIQFGSVPGSDHAGEPAKCDLPSDGGQRQ